MVMTMMTMKTKENSTHQRSHVMTSQTSRCQVTTPKHEVNTSETKQVHHFLSHSQSEYIHLIMEQEVPEQHGIIIHHHLILLHFHSSKGGTKVGILLRTTPMQPPTAASPPFPTVLLNNCSYDSIGRSIVPFQNYPNSFFGFKTC